MDEAGRVVKRSLSVLVLVALLAAVAGWASAKIRAGYRVSETMAQERLAQNAAEAEARKPARYFARLAREADEIVLTYRSNQGVREVRLQDTQLLAELADILGSGSYQPVPPGLWVSTPEVTLHRTKVQTFFLMSNGGTLRAYGKEHAEDYAVGEKLTAALQALIAKSVPDHAAWSL